MGDFHNKDAKNNKKIFQYAHILGKCSFTQTAIKANNSRF